jgi:hypothetical protein
MVLMEYKRNKRMLKGYARPYFQFVIMANQKKRKKGGLS